MTLENGSTHAFSHRRPLSLTPERVRAAEFVRTSLGRRGYREDDVRLFLIEVAEFIAGFDAEQAKLRAEIERLRNWYRQQGVDVDNPANQDRPQPTIAAVNVVSEAQQAADSRIAQAEDFARRLVARARQQYECILREAQHQAQEAAAEAAAQTASAYRERLDTHTGGGEHEHLERKIAYLRSFAETSQVHLRSVLEALTRELDQLGELPDRTIPAEDHARP